MENNIFINQAFTNAIQLYITNKDKVENIEFSSFPVLVIRSLIAIYGELDIINPYRTNNENRMGGFNSNLTKFGFSKEELEKFKEEFQKYMDTKNQIQLSNQYIINIEKYLIDMYCCRKKNVNIKEEETENFKKNLYISTNSNPVIQKEIQQRNLNYKIIEQYFFSKLFELNHNFILTPYKKNTLFPEAYTVLGYTLDNIAQMNEKTLEQLNKQIYAFFKINYKDENSQERLKEAVNYYKQYGNSITTGNGYVDMLLLLSIIATIMMTLFAITVKVLGG